MFALESMYVCVMLMGCMIIEPEFDAREDFTHPTRQACADHAQAIGDDVAKRHNSPARSFTSCVPIVNGEWPDPTDYHEPPFTV